MTAVKTGRKAARSFFDVFDELPRSPAATAFERVVERRISRRALLGGGVGLGLAACAPLGSATTPPAARGASRLTFEAVEANGRDTVTLPPGYRWDVLVSWGDPLWSDAPAFDEATTGTGSSQEKAFGDNNDGMELFSRNGRTVLAVNNEYVTLGIMFAARESGRPETLDDVRKCKAGHGVSILEVAHWGSAWRVVKDSPFNRRITPDTPMAITGPARGHPLLRTAADPVGEVALGTWSNCGSGRTPWGSYLSCEEKFSGYFSSSDPAYRPGGDQSRYGIRAKDNGCGWARADERFDIAKHPNEPNRAGYVIEIDPLDPSSIPKKRTALGRFKHENAELALAGDGRVVIYLGDDERGEFLYRFVSARAYAADGDNAELLDDGALFVARFDDDGSGEWVELTPEKTGMGSKAEICVCTRQAASAVGATTMDRPEWVAVNPHRAEAYCCLTNNRKRGVEPNAGGDPTPVNGPNPRRDNRYGQILRWVPRGGDHGAAAFDWDLFLMAGNPTVHQDAYAGSEHITAANMFNSPDGLAFDSAGLLWIQTDGDDSNQGDFAGQGNNQMLIADPLTGELRRFMVGPKECEVTGLAFSVDRRTAFAGIQHPGRGGNGHFPGAAGSLPRSCVIAITREDGGPVA